MSRRSRELSEEEKALWFRVGEGAKRTRARNRGAAEPALVKAPTARLTGAKLPAHKASMPSKPETPPAHRGGEKRVRRGRLDIGASLDLHGHTQVEAHSALERFLALAVQADHRVVIVVTGVGRGGEGVLKRRLPEWLSAPSVRALVSGFAPAHRKHGGAGAYYVFLKRRSNGEDGDF